MIERAPTEPTPMIPATVLGRLRFIRWMAYHQRMGRIPEGRAAGEFAMSLVMTERKPVETILSERPYPKTDFEQQH